MDREQNGGSHRAGVGINEMGNFLLSQRELSFVVCIWCACQVFLAAMDSAFPEFNDEIDQKTLITNILRFQGRDHAVERASWRNT